MSRILVFLLLFCTLKASQAVELFPDGKALDFPKDFPLDHNSTASGYPIFGGDGNWKIRSISGGKATALGDFQPTELGTVLLTHSETDGNWFANMWLVVSTQATGGANIFTTGSPCGGSHIVSINKGVRYDDNCLTIDASNFQAGNRQITYFEVTVTQTRSGGRRYVMGLRLNAEMLGFRGTTPTDWNSPESLRSSSSRSAFMEKLTAWSKLLQESTVNVLDYSKPQNIFSKVPSYRSLLEVPKDLADGGFSQSFISGVESIKNKPQYRAIAYSKIGPGRTRWNSDDGKESQDAANKAALTACEKGRPSDAPACKLYDFLAPVEMVAAASPNLPTPSAATNLPNDGEKAEIKFSRGDITPLVGRWTSRDETGRIGWFEFQKNGQMDLMLPGETQSFKDKVLGDKGKVLFKFWPSFNPNYIDIIGQRADGADIVLPCVVKLIDEDTLQMNCGFSGDRPRTVSGAMSELFKRQR
jgi:hypothetical protein